MKSLACLLVLAAAGCVSAKFHPRTAYNYASVVPRAVVIDDHTARDLVAHGGIVIGTISTDGTTDKNAADLADKAAVLAAQSGGTHVVMTNEGAITNTFYHPAQENEQCSGTGDGYQCQTVVTPAYETSASRPTADFEVIRVEPSQWGQLPPNLRPGPPPVASR